MRRRRSKISVNVIVNGERGREGGRLVVTNKPEEEGRVERGKNTEAPPLRSFDPFLPSFPYFSTVPPKPLFGRRSFPCFRTKAKPHCSNQCTQTDGEFGSPRGPTCDRSISGERERRGYFHAHWVTVKPRGRFIFLDNTPLRPSVQTPLLPHRHLPLFLSRSPEGLPEFR